MNNGERKLVEYNRGYTGSFYTHLFNAIFKADGNNLDKLEKGFPEEVEAVKRWRNEDGYAEELENEYNQS